MTRRAFILTGSREWTDVEAIRAVVLPLAVGDTLMICGACETGADRIAEGIWLNAFYPLIRMPAQWERFEQMGNRNAAGPARNREMLAVLCALARCGYAVSVEAFSLPQSRGTKNMIAFAKGAGVVVNEHGRTK